MKLFTNVFSCFYTCVIDSEHRHDRFEMILLFCSSFLLHQFLISGLLDQEFAKNSRPVSTIYPSPLPQVLDEMRGSLNIFRQQVTTFVTTKVTEAGIGRTNELSELQTFLGTLEPDMNRFIEACTDMEQVGYVFYILEFIFLYFGVIVLHFGVI